MNNSHRVFAFLTLFMGLMTAAWSSNALESVPVLGGIGLLLGVLGVIACVLALLSKRSGAAPEVQAPRGGLVSSRAAGVFAGIEMLVIPVVCILLGRSGHGALVVPAVAVIVAAHFALFRLVQKQVLHVVTAVVGCLGAGLAIVLIVRGDLDPAAGRALAGLSLAACTAAYAVVFGRAALRTA